MMSTKTAFVDKEIERLQTEKADMEAEEKRRAEEDAEREQQRLAAAEEAFKEGTKIAKEIGERVQGVKTEIPCPVCRPWAHLKNALILGQRFEFGGGVFIPFLRQGKDGLYRCPLHPDDHVFGSI